MAALMGLMNDEEDNDDRGSYDADSESGEFFF